MGQMIQFEGELIRINPSKNSIEYFSTNGRSWHHRASASLMVGTMNDLLGSGKELLVNTSKGLYYSTTKGRSWYKRS